LRSLNQALVEKTTKQRRKKTGKHFGEGCVLTVEDILTKTQGREAREAIEGVERGRKG
jgi:hypothetical protein